MKLFLASDHAGFSLKSFLIRNLVHNCIDLGTYTENSCDYPFFAEKLVRPILDVETSSKKSYDSIGEDIRNFGVLICGTGIGMSIAANRHRFIRAALCFDEEMAIMARKHNNANVIVLGARKIAAGAALACVQAFVSAKFEGGRHLKRIRMIDCGD